MSDFTCNESKTTLTEAMSQAWQTEKRHIIITGDGGAGKSTLLASTFLQLVSSDTVVPLYFDLSGDLSGMSEKETIQHRLITDYCGQLENETSSQALYKLFSGGGALPAPKFVFLIDGINESEAPGQYITEIISNLLEYDSVQVVMASRYFLPELVKYCCEYRISPLSKEQVSKVFESSHISIEDLPDGIRSLMNRPLFLTMYIKEWAEKGLTATEQLINTAGEFFNAHFDRLINKKSQTVDSYPRAEFALRYLLPAMTLFLSYEFSWYHFCEVLNDTHPKVKDRYDAFEEIHSFSGKAAELLILLKNKGIISDTTKKNTYRFRHAYYREFLQAMYACNEMERAVNGATDEPMPLLPFEQKHRMSEDMIRWIGEILGEDHRKGEYSITEQFLKRSTPIYHGNSVEILKQSRAHELSVDFSGLSLFDVRLYDVDLLGSSFKKTKALTLESFKPLGERTEWGYHYSPFISPDGSVIVSEQDYKLLIQLRYMHNPFIVDLINSCRFLHFIGENELLYLDSIFICIIDLTDLLNGDVSETTHSRINSNSIRRCPLLDSHSTQNIVDIHCSKDTTIFAVLHTDHVEYINTNSNSVLRFSVTAGVHSKVVILGDTDSRLVSVIGNESGELQIVQLNFYDSHPSISLISNLQIFTWAEAERFNSFITDGNRFVLIESVLVFDPFANGDSETRLSIIDVNETSLNVLQDLSLANTSCFDTDPDYVHYLTYKTERGCFSHLYQISTGLTNEDFIGNFRPVFSNRTHCIISTFLESLSDRENRFSRYFPYYVYSLREKKTLWPLGDNFFTTEPFISNYGNWVAVVLESSNFQRIKIINRLEWERCEVFSIDLDKSCNDTSRPLTHFAPIHLHFVGNDQLIVKWSISGLNRHVLINLDGIYPTVQWGEQVLPDCASDSIITIYDIFQEELPSAGFLVGNESPIFDLHDFPHPKLIIREPKVQLSLSRLVYRYFNESASLSRLWENPMSTIALSEEHMLLTIAYLFRSSLLTVLVYHNLRTKEFTLLDIDDSEREYEECEHFEYWFGGRECITAVLCDGSLRIWSTKTGKTLARIDKFFHDPELTIRLIGCSPDCKRFYLYFSDDFELERTQIGGRYAVVYLDSDATTYSSEYYWLDLPVSENGIAVCADDDTVTLFNCYTGRIIDKITPLVSDVSGCDFAGAEMDDELKRILRQNGAIVDPE